MNLNKNLITRMHPLKTYEFAFIKRDDELGDLVPGTKFRKYSSLIPWLKSQGFKKVIIIGGQCSNNVLGLSHECVKSGILPILYLLKANSVEGSRNWELLSLLLNNNPQVRIQYFNRQEWVHINVLAQQKESGLGAYVVPEGAFCIGSLEGALTLGEDIWRNLLHSSKPIEHLYLDSGTGLGAAAAILRLSQIGFQGKYFITQLAPLEGGFKGVLQEVFHWAQVQWDQNLLKQIEILEPPTAKSFGAINKTLKTFIREFAIKEGILLDPVYSAKHFLTAFKNLEKHNVPSLIVHSGGQQSNFLSLDNLKAT